MKKVQLYLRCEHCCEFFKHDGGKRRRWCSGRCKVAAWRKKRAAELDKPGAYEKFEAAQKYLKRLKTIW